MAEPGPFFRHRLSTHAPHSRRPRPRPPGRQARRSAAPGHPKREPPPAQDRTIDVLVLHEALEHLRQLDPRQERIVELYFFSGLNFEEIAEVLEVSDRTVKRDWSMARLAERSSPKDMTPELYQRLKPLYDAALDMPKEKRAAFVVEASGDDRELRAELEVVLANGERTATLGEPFIRLEGLFAGPERAFADGELIWGRFEIVRHLGSGGMGEVYEAVDRQLGRVALKTIRPVVTADPKLLSRFKKEVQLARKVSSRHVCRIHELFYPETLPTGHESHS